MVRNECWPAILYHYVSAVHFVLDVIMEDVSVVILTVLTHYFRLGLKATEAVPRNHKVEENETLSFCTIRNWFKDGNFSFKIKPRRGQHPVVNNFNLKCKVKENLTSCT